MLCKQRTNLEKLIIIIPLDNTKNEDIKLTEHTCKTILTYDVRIWVKKDSGRQLNVPLGSFLGA